MLCLLPALISQGGPLLKPKTRGSAEEENKLVCFKTNVIYYKN